nr:hypothetical protein GCM10020093_015720 [Planobispora longispora]
MRHRHVAGVPQAERGLPGRPGLVGPVLRLEAAGQQARRLGGELGMPGGQRGPGRRPRSGHVSSLLEHGRQAHRGLRAIGPLGVGRQFRQDLRGAVQVAALGEPARGLQGTRVHLRHAGSSPGKESPRA